MNAAHRNRAAALYALLCVCVSVLGGKTWEEKFSILRREDPENPKCFAEDRMNLTCFWEEDEETAGPVEEYSFTYNYQHEDSVQCPLRSLLSSDRRTLFTCQVIRTKMFVQMDIYVHRKGGLIHNRTLFVDMVFLLDPPANVTVNRTEKQDQLNVSWVAPKLKYMDDSMMYQIRYSSADGLETQVTESLAVTEKILTNLRPGVKYEVQVRIKLDGISYDGYWSAWSTGVFMETPPAEFDPLILCLTLIISFILLVFSLTILLSHRRFLTKKIWPVVPTPENKFPGLFSVYGGDFQEWLGHTRGGLWVAADYLFSEERPSLLEVISEFRLGPPLVSPPLPPKAPRGLTLGREENQEVLERSASTVTHDPWLMDRVLHQTALLESQDPYVTLSNPPDGEQVDELLEESLPLEVLFHPGVTALCESHSDLGSGQQSSGSRMSSQSSFEYPNQAWTRKGPGYTYMAVADSGVSMDYSPMSRVEDVGRVPVYANDYKNDIMSQKTLFLQRQRAVDDND